MAQRHHVALAGRRNVIQYSTNYPSQQMLLPTIIRVWIQVWNRLPWRGATVRCRAAGLRR